MPHLNLIPTLAAITAANIVGATDVMAVFDKSAGQAVSATVTAIAVAGLAGATTAVVIGGGYANGITVTGAAAAGAPSIAATGSDTNINLALTPKGTGAVQFGTHAAIGAELVTGYITINDAAGTARKIAVVS